MGRILEDQYFGFSHELSLEEVEASMYPSESITYGFLGRNERLHSVMEDDKATLQQLGLSYETFALGIEKLFLYDDSMVNGNLVFRKGFIHSPVCPWKDYCTVSPFDFTLKVTKIILVNTKKLQNIPWLRRKMIEKGKIKLEDYKQLVDEDIIMIFSDLHPHLIKDHHFFEGHETPYRVDPERALKYLPLV